MRSCESLFVSLLAAAVLAACATSPTGRSQLMLVSPEAAIASSQKAYANVLGQFSEQNRLAEDPVVAARVREVTGRIVHVAREQFPASSDWEWSVAVIDDPDTVNAWCMAGGRMAVYTGLLEQLELTDDELAHIMGHEAAHALANHTAEQMSRAMVSQVALAGAQLAGVDAGALQGAALAAQLAVQLPNSRVAETEADQIGAELAIRAGYDPDAAVSLWRKMGQLGGQRPPVFLSTHPSPENRLERLAVLGDELRPLNPTGRKVPVYPVRIIADVQ